MSMNLPSEKKKVGFFASSIILLACCFILWFGLAAIKQLTDIKFGGFILAILPALIARHYIVKAIEKRKNRAIKTLDPKEAKPLSSLRTRN